MIGGIGSRVGGPSAISAGGPRGKDRMGNRISQHDGPEMHVLALVKGAEG